jgi:uncharacterized protein
MNEQHNIEIVGRGYEAFGRGDITTLLTLFDENILWSSPGPPELATAGTRRGKQEVAEFFQAVDSLFEMQRFEPELFMADGNRVVVLGSETAKVKATGKVLEQTWAHAFTLLDGKVVAFQEYIDTSALVAELRAAQVAA